MEREKEQFRAKDSVDELIQRIRKNESVQKTKFNASFLNNTAAVFESKGFGATEVFLLNKKGRDELRVEASALLEVLELLRGYKPVESNRSIGGLIIKTINEIKHDC